MPERSAGTLAAEVCRLLGGGGHAAAAGCTVEAPWAQAKEQILDAVARVVPDCRIDN